ncbi:MAG TPA: hypothetical protein VGS07_09760 [Thermoanaerobaculia bacterium]|nr:hypothetical protein [Thermoanaerobaculia bacterium]
MEKLRQATSATVKQRYWRLMKDLFRRYNYEKTNNSCPCFERLGELSACGWLVSFCDIRSVRMGRSAIARLHVGKIRFGETG